MRLTLIRHAEPQAALDAIVAGPVGCRGLSALGRVQAYALAERLRATGELKPDVVLTSVLSRAIETADALADAIGRASRDCDLCELHPGDCDGQAWEDHADRYPSPSNPDLPFSAGGESLSGFDRRVRRAVSNILLRHAGKDVTVVTHSGVIEAVTLLLLGAPGLADQARFRVDSLQYTSISEWQRMSDSRWRLERYNDHAHLDGLERTSPGSAWEPA